MKKTIIIMCFFSFVSANETKVFLDTMNTMSSNTVRIIKDYYSAINCTKDFYDYTTVSDIKLFMNSEYFVKSQALTTLGGFDDMQYQSKLQLLRAESCKN